jgi:hypothetical protein
MTVTAREADLNVTLEVLHVPALLLDPGVAVQHFTHDV